MLPAILCAAQFSGTYDCMPQFQGYAFDLPLKWHNVVLRCNEYGGYVEEKRPSIRLASSSVSSLS